MSEVEWTEADDIIEETREARRRLWERFDNDPKRYMAYMKELHQQLLREGWVEAPSPPPEYARRVRQALARARRYPHLLDRADAEER